MKVPISLIIDDPAPIISVFYEHAKNRTMSDGRTLIPTYSNEGLFRFCDIIEKHGIKGKFSVVPMPGNKGDIVRGIEGVDNAQLAEWLDTVRKRVAPQFAIGPEMLTHHKAVDLATGNALDMNEAEYSATQDRTTLTPYISLALKLLREAGFAPCGVTSPWRFGIAVEEEYEAAISAAVDSTCGEKNAWFFLRGVRGVPNARPWVAREEDGRTLVSIPATTYDVIWQTISNADTSDEFVSQVADGLISADGQKGSIIDVLNTNGYPILVTHWQSLMSNGLMTGLRALDEIARRINIHLSDRVEWKSFIEIMEMVVADKDAYPKPKF